MNPSQKASSRERVGSRENLGFREKTILLSKEERPWIEGILGSPAIGKGTQSWGGRLFQNSLVQGPCFLSRCMIKAFPSQHIDTLRTFLIPYQDPTAINMRPSGGKGEISLLWVWLLWAKHWKTSFWGAWGAHPRPYVDSTVSGGPGRHCSLYMALMTSNWPTLIPGGHTYVLAVIFRSIGSGISLIYSITPMSSLLGAISPVTKVFRPFKCSLWFN